MSQKDFAIFVSFPCKDSKEVTLSIHTGTHATNPYWHIPLPFSDPIIAEVMGNHLRQMLETTMTKIREANYEKGWRDAKAKRRKKNWFSCRLIRKDDE